MKRAKRERKQEKLNGKIQKLMDEKGMSFKDASNVVYSVVSDSDSSEE